MKNLINIICGVFIAVGSILLIIVFMNHLSREEFKKHADYVEAYVVGSVQAIHPGRSSTGRAKLIQYEYKGKTYGPVSLGSYCWGSTVDIYVDRKNPYEFIWDFDALGFILGLIGVACVGMGSAPLIIMASHKFGKKRLIKKGDKIVGMVESVELDTSVELNGENPWMVVCTWTSPQGETCKFTSETIYSNPENIIKPGDDIIIYVDRDNMERYYVDIKEKMSKIHEM